MKFVAEIKPKSKTQKKFIKLAKSKNWDGILAIGANCFTMVEDGVFECEDVVDISVLQDNPDVLLIVFGFDPTRLVSGET